jgi:hypothetical protein
MQRVLDQARELAEHIERNGFPVSHVKLEAMMNNPIVPTAPEAAAGMTNSQYFECHVKELLLDAERIGGSTRSEFPQRVRLRARQLISA